MRAQIATIDRIARGSLTINIISSDLRARPAAHGREAFILSGYPHIAEADLFARHVLNSIEHGR